MKLAYFFLGTSALFSVAAIPMLPSGCSSAPNPHYVPKVDFRYRPISKNDRTATRAMMIDHYRGLEPGNEHKQARLAYAEKGWRDGKGPDDEHRQYLDFDYHRGEHLDSDKIGQTVTIARDRPLPESHFTNTIMKEHKAEMAKEMNKKYEALPPELAKRVRSMKVHMDWSDGPGLREQTQMTFHHNAVPLLNNKLGDPVTIYRPMSFLIHDNVPKKEIVAIKKRIRQEHEKLDEDHPLKKANYGVVIEGWHIMAGKRKSQQVGTMMYKVKDELTDNAEEGFEKIGEFHVPLGHGRRSEAASSSLRSTRERQG